MAGMVFHPFYAMLAAVPSFAGTQVWAVLVMGAAIAVLFFLPGWIGPGSIPFVIAGRYIRLCSYLRRSLSLGGVADWSRLGLSDPAKSLYACISLSFC